PDTLTDHLGVIAAKEKVEIDRDSLAMIARAAEGSVRDALSILDQALVQQTATGEAPGAETIRAMLGLADRSQVWELVKAALAGDAKTALEEFERQYDSGADPAVIIRDMLEVIHLLTRVKASGPEAANHGAAGEADAARARDMAEKLSMNALTRAWSLLMKGLAETREAPDPAAAGEMALIRLAYAADLPTPDEALRMLKSGGTVSAPRGGAAPSSAPSPAPRGSARAQTAPREESEPTASYVAAPQARASAGPMLASFADVVKLAAAKRDAKLRTELESYVHLVSFAEGRIEMRLEDRAPTDLSGRLALRLKEWTGAQWLVTVNASVEGAPTLRDARTAEVMEHPLVKKAFEIFPGAEIMSIRDAQAPAVIEPEENDDEEAE
ncbi:MAG: hypothetical protein RIC52_16555, partial [Amphiplicatus sp.]